MARRKGSNPMGGNIELNFSGPLDARTVVTQKSELTVASNFLYAYAGLEVYVESEKKKYTLIGLPTTTESNWVESGGGGSVTIDPDLDPNSHNAVENSAITAGIDAVMQNTLTNRSSIQALDVSVKAIQSSMTTVEEAIQKNTTSIGKLDVRVKSLEDEMPDFRDAIARNSTSIARLQTSVAGNKTSIALLDARIGSLSDLKTSAKTTIVEAINEAVASGGAVLSTSLTVSNPIGKATMDKVYDADTPLETLLRAMLANTYNPTLTPPSVSITWNVPALAKVGATVNAVNATVSFNRGRINPEYGTDGYRAGVATGYAVSLTGADSPFTDNNATGQFNVPAFTRATKGNVVLTGTVSHEAGQQPKDSDGNNYDNPYPAGDLSNTKTVDFIIPFYYGATKTLPRTDLSGLTEDLTKKGAKTYTVATNSEYVTFAYDAAYGDLKSIRDEGDQENIDGYAKTQITVGGVLYNVYTSQFLTVDPAAIYKLSF